MHPDFWEAFFQWFWLGVLRLIGYRSLSADNRLGMFDRRSLKRLISKKRYQADHASAVRGLTIHAAAPSFSVRCWWNNYNIVQFIFLHWINYKVIWKDSVRHNVTNGVSEYHARALSLLKCANGFKSPHIMSVYACGTVDTGIVTRTLARGSVLLWLKLINYIYF